MVRPRGRARVKTYLRMEGLLSTPLLLAGKVDSLSIIKRKTYLCVSENQSAKLQGKLMSAFRARSKTSSKIIKNRARKFTIPYSLLEKQQKIQGS